MSDPRAHVNEEPRNDFLDLVVGVAGMTAFMVIVFLLATVFDIVLR